MLGVEAGMHLGRPQADARSADKLQRQPRAMRYLRAVSQGAPTLTPQIKRLIAAAQAYLEEETEVARVSYQDHHRGVDGPPTWSDDIWRAADPTGARLAIELRRALKAIK